MGGGGNGSGGTASLIGGMSRGVGSGILSGGQSVGAGSGMLGGGQSVGVGSGGVFSSGFSTPASDIRILRAPQVSTANALTGPDQVSSVSAGSQTAPNQVDAGAMTDLTGLRQANLRGS